MFNALHSGMLGVKIGGLVAKPLSFLRSLQDELLYFNG